MYRPFPRHTRLTFNEMQMRFIGDLTTKVKHCCQLSVRLTFFNAISLSHLKFYFLTLNQDDTFHLANCKIQR